MDFRFPMMAPRQGRNVKILDNGCLRLSKCFPKRYLLSSESLWLPQQIRKSHDEERKAEQKHEELFSKSVDYAVEKK